MTPTPKLPSGVRRLFRLRWTRAHITRDLDDELRFHLEMRMSELESRGMNTPDAQREALRRLGDVDDLRAYCARTDEQAAIMARAADWGADLARDFLLALRHFRRAAAFTALALITLALGVGANTAIFSVVYALLLDPLPYANSDRIVGLRQEAGDGEMLFPVDAAAIRVWAARSRSLEEFSAATSGRVAVGSATEADTVAAAAITPGFVRTLNLRPEIGRAFSAEDLHEDQTVMLIGSAFWKSRFGGDPDAIGRVVRVNGKPRTIIGVMPPRTAVPFTHGALPDVWLPLDLDHNPGSANGFARLRAGVTTDVASRELQAILATLPEADRYAKTRARAMRAQEFLDRTEVRTVEVLFVAVSVLLLIACANVANLLLARSWTRRREFAIRAALGAGRGRLVRQVLTESTTLAVIAGALGLLIAWEGLRVIVGLRPPTLIELADIHLEPTVLAWSALVSVATGILFGSIPAFVVGSRIVSEALRSAGHGMTTMSGRRLRSSLVVFEIALSVTLLIGAALLVRSFAALQRMPLGYEPRNLISIPVFFRGGAAARRASLEDQLLERLRAVPGVHDAAVGSLPGRGWSIASPIEVDGQTRLDSPAIREFTTAFVSSEYFRTTGIALIAGRTLESSSRKSTETENASASEIVINKTLAKKLWSDRSAIGGRLRTNDSAPWSTVVGVVDDVRMPGFHGDGPSFQLYSPPIPQIAGLSYVVRATGSTTALVPALRRAIVDAGVGATVGTVTTGDEYLRDTLAPSRFSMALLTTFALLALTLSAIGLYGVIAYTVSQRTHEIGVRVALGANASDVVTMIISDSVKLTLVGVVLGIVGALATSRALDSMLYGVTAADPITFAITPVLLGAVAFIATYVPARRALRIDPIEALRTE